MSWIIQEVQTRDSVNTSRKKKQHFKVLNTGSHISLAAGDKKCKLECLLNMVGIADVSWSYLL